MMIDDDFFCLEFSEGDCMLDDEDPSHYAYSTRGRIVSIDEDLNRTLAGKFDLYYMDVCAALNAKTSVFDIFDCREETLDYFQSIFDYPTLNVSPKLIKLLDCGSWGNVLIINRLELLPRFRHHNLGLIVMRRLIERFGSGAFVVAIKPFPLQQELSDEDEWRSSLKLTNLDKDMRRSTAKLRRHYAQLGFKSMKGTPFMFLLTDDPLPSLKSLKK